MKRRGAGLLVVSLGLAGCMHNYAYTQTGPHRPANPASCSVRLYTTPPPGAFEELGVLEINGGWGAVRSAGQFLDANREQVCAVGGNAVLTEINGYGQYVRATVLRVDEGPQVKHLSR